ncbi:hypothetical protein QBC46DRAFT_403262 [Diplogelasinospora grovesii]|uniref:GDS1 winged helix domain-containing protein n=1 Tax=Diplogelasinospora grovesii TaxID=303347 RepID=A0AAN6S9N5_9PEZI|nr:hypothetical protein QBC46DRAFT_403262 [Diplogelasinospora grovesii]
MPYNTRRKSLSLPSLGIHVPVTHAARAAAAAAAAAAANRASPNSTSPTSTSTSTNSPRATSPSATMTPSSPTLSSISEDVHPSKKLKRAHCEDADSAHTYERLPKRRDDASMKFENTPPPSPTVAQQSVEMEEESDAAVSKTIDLEGINDEIVEAVIVQLQNTGNRPHLVKELAAVLMQQLKIVQQSANPCAIISSRLATYLKRSSWSALAPCPLAKELETVHPRRTYFYLTTCPHLPLPDPAQAATLGHLAHSRAIISPSISSATSNSEDADLERRRELSPSPEVDLSSPEFDDIDDDVAMPSTPIGSLSLRGFGLVGSHFLHHHAANGAGVSGRNHRAASPPLEKDEKEFTQTADGLQKRKQNGDLLSAAKSPERLFSMDMDFGAKDESSLFGDKMLMAAAPVPFVTSPAIRPSTISFNLSRKDAETDNWLKLDNMLDWDRSPENIELEELDGLLNDY